MNPKQSKSKRIIKIIPIWQILAKCLPKSLTVLMIFLFYICKNCKTSSLTPSWCYPIKQQACRGNILVTTKVRATLFYCLLERKKKKKRRHAIFYSRCLGCFWTVTKFKVNMWKKTLRVDVKFNRKQLISHLYKKDTLTNEAM